MASRYGLKLKHAIGHAERLQALIDREERHRQGPPPPPLAPPPLSYLETLKLVRQRPTRKPAGPRPERKPPAERKPIERVAGVTLKIGRRADGRWQKKIHGRLVYLGGSDTSEAEARAMLVRLLTTADEHRAYAV